MTPGFYSAHQYTQIYWQFNCVLCRSGVIHEGDRVLTINGQDCCELTLEEINHILAESWQHAKLEVEFDVADTVMASSGVFVVKLPRKHGGLGITLSGKWTFYMLAD